MTLLSLSYLVMIAAEIALITFAILVLYHYRERLGMAPIYIFVGSIQYLQNFFPTALYIPIATEYYASPSFLVLLPSTLFAILLIYINEGVPKTRMLIYGVVSANMLLAMISLFSYALVKLGGTIDLTGAPENSLYLSPRLFLIGMATLLIDITLIVIAYEFFSQRLHKLHSSIKIFLSLLLVLCTDTIIFNTVVFWEHPYYHQIIKSALLGSFFSSLLFSLLLYIYLGYSNDQFPENVPLESKDRLKSLFAILTYRQQYEQLKNEIAEQEKTFAEERQVVLYALKESEQRHLLLFKHMTDGVLLIDAQNAVIIDVNPAFINLTGYPAHTLLGQMITDFSFFETSSLDHILKHTPNIDVRMDEIALFNVHKQTICIELLGSHYTTQRGTVIMLSFRDITERKQEEAAKQKALEARVVESTEKLSETHLRLMKINKEKDRAEAALYQSEKRYSHLVELSPMSIILCRQERIIFANQATLEILEATDEKALLGCFFHDLFPFEQQQNIRDLMSKAFKEQETLQYIETQFVQFDETSIDLELTLIPFLEEERPTILAVAYDITERKRLEALKDDFVSTVSHELRTPLTSIKGSLGLLGSGITGELTEQAQQLIELSARNCDRLVRLLNDLLDLQKMEAGQVPFRMEPVEVYQLLQQAHITNASLGAQNRVSIEMLPSPTNLFINADHDKLIQVLTNLISNAIKFSPPGGSVTLQVEDKGKEIKVSVSDQGKGIPDDFRPHIFKKFSQADASATKRHGGTGLGLSISKMIINRLNGEIDFETTKGKGTTFYFTLPRNTEL